MTPVARHLAVGLLALSLPAVLPCVARAQIFEPEPIPAGQPGPPGPYAPGVDVLHYDVELGLDSASESMEARALIRLRLEEPVPPAVVLDLTGLAIHGVEVDGTDAEARLEAGRLHVPLPGGHGAGDEVEVTVAYGGTPDDGLILGPNVHGSPSAFADNWPNRARFWFPSVDHPSDKATVAFTVHAPADWQVVANGRLEGEPTATAAGAPGGHVGKRTWRWATEVDIPTYTMVVGAADLSVAEVGTAACGRAPAAAGPSGCVEVTTWVFPPDTARAAPSFRRAAEMTDFFTDLVGPFPYEKLAHVQSATRFGGMENASAIFYSEDAIATGRDIEGTVSHEIAHQWFGDSVTETDWRHLWLSEGFATYFGALYFQQADGEASFRQRMARNRDRYLGSGMAARPVLDDDVTDLFALLNANNYQKGGWVLHMLRSLVGDEAFFAGVRAYYGQHAHGNALTDDFRRHVEEASGRDLAWFFEQWLERPGHPMLDVSWQESPAGGGLRVRQAQGGRPFRFPLTVGLEEAGGATRRVSVEVTEADRVFPVQGPAPDRIHVDPDQALLIEVAGTGR